MAAIASINAAVSGVFTATRTTLTASDTITYDPTKLQLLVLHNPTGGALNVTIDGDGGTTVPIDGLGSVSVASGLAVSVPAGEARAVKLSTVRHYLQGVVSLTGGAGLVASLFNL